MHVLPLTNRDELSIPTVGRNAGGCATAVEATNGTKDVQGNVVLSVEGIRERKALERWVDMFGICLLPFCAGSTTGRRLQGASAQCVAGEFDSDSDEDSEVEDEDDGFTDGQARSEWVSGWLRRAGVAGTEPLECPFDVQTGGCDERLAHCLAAHIVSHAKVTFFLRVSASICSAVCSSCADLGDAWRCCV